MNGPYFGPCTTIRQYRDRDRDLQDKDDAELEAARQEADSFSFGLKHEFFNPRLEIVMTKEELAAQLSGAQYRNEITKEMESAAKASGLVVVFGASDDLMEFRGAIRDELEAWEGTTAYLTSAGMLQNDCENDDCPHFEKLKASARTVQAVWDRDGYSWIYKTSIPHATFQVFEGDDTYCLGIVFALADV